MPPASTSFHRRLHRQIDRQRQRLMPPGRIAQTSSKRFLDPGHTRPPRPNARLVAEARAAQDVRRQMAPLG
jgi:hypothetical protein